MTPAPEHDAARDPGPSDAARAARELLARTVELPSWDRQLVAILREYRIALHALATEPGTAGQPGR
jgi:hypothetical protein